MLSREIARLENENFALREELRELNAKMESNAVLKPKSCQYCKNYIQHYIKTVTGGYKPIYAGHCISGVKTKRRKKSNPDDTCPYFELGTQEAQLYL